METLQSTLRLRFRDEQLAASGYTVIGLGMFITPCMVTKVGVTPLQMETTPQTHPPRKPPRPAGQDQSEKDR